MKKVYTIEITYVFVIGNKTLWYILKTGQTFEAKLGVRHGKIVAFQVDTLRWVALQHCKVIGERIQD